MDIQSHKKLLKNHNTKGTNVNSLSTIIGDFFF